MNTLKYVLGTGFYTGSVAIAPGTVSSLAALAPLFLLLDHELGWAIPLFVLSASLLSLWVAPYFEDVYGKDPPMLTLDEWAGQAVVFLPFVYTEPNESLFIVLLAGFLLFRFFDILKPLGIKRIQNLPGGWGILLDDILAGLYALLCLKTLIFAKPIIFGLI